MTDPGKKPTWKSRRNVLRTGAIAGVGFFGFSTVSQAGAQEYPTMITECQQIDEPGEYVLGDDLSAEGNCLQFDVGVTLDGNGHTIEGDGTGTGLQLESGGSTVRNLTIQNFEDGIIFGPASNFDLSSITIQDNKRYGIWCQGSRGILCEDLTIRHNDDAGVSVSDYSSDITMRNCDMVQNGSPVRAGSSATFGIEDCRIVDNGGPVSFTPMPESTIKGTLVSGSDEAGLRTNYGDKGFFDVPTPIRNCVIQDCNGAGIDQPNGNLDVRECTLSGNRIGYQVAGTTDPYETVLRHNNIENNEEYGLLHSNPEEYSTTIDATCNWWGHPSGPQHDDNPRNNPQGDTVEGDVDFQPWSTRRFGRGGTPGNSCVGGNESSRGKGRGRGRGRGRGNGN